jgi:hypothetical protein
MLDRGLSKRLIIHEEQVHSDRKPASSEARSLVVIVRREHAAVISDAQGSAFGDEFKLRIISAQQLASQALPTV